MSQQPTMQRDEWLEAKHIEQIPEAVTSKRIGNLAVPARARRPALDRAVRLI
jgi:hypothetical protein